MTEPLTQNDLKVRRKLRAHLRQLDRIEEQTGWHLEYFDPAGVWRFCRDPVEADGSTPCQQIWATTDDAALSGALHIGPDGSVSVILPEGSPYNDQTRFPAGDYEVEALPGGWHRIKEPKKGE